MMTEPYPSINALDRSIAQASNAAMEEADRHGLPRVGIAGAPADDDPEVSADEACEIALNALDRLMVLAAKDDTAPLVAANRIFVGLILQRSNTLARLLMAKDTLRFVNHA